ncbi:MAG TPA: SIR2 family protein [Pyrinomonadaceae bacterium]|nr:SIR2 family protein [Pyrinomonadaceae bacterium]
MSETLTDNDWDILIQRIRDKKCTPFLGAGACYGVLPLGAAIAQQWASQYEYPLDDASNLIAVAQFLALKNDRMFPKEEIVRMFKTFKEPDYTNPAEPHRVLASLPLPLYVTTNYDNFMTQALLKCDKDARQELCRWNKYLKDMPSGLDNGFKPSTANPLVFHLHGYNPLAESLVLTEDDYMDFLVNISVDDQLIPPLIQKAFTGTSLLFIGYRIADWNFRVLLRGLSRYMESGLRRSHFAVLTTPSASEELRAKARDYLSEYYENIDVRVYWGSATDFVGELRRRMAA